MAIRGQPGADQGPNRGPQWGLAGTDPDYWRHTGDPGRTRTSNPELRRLVLYPVELRGRNRARPIQCVHNPLRVNLKLSL